MSLEAVCRGLRRGKRGWSRGVSWLIPFQRSDDHWANHREPSPKTTIWESFLRCLQSYERWPSRNPKFSVRSKNILIFHHKLVRSQKRFWRPFEEILYESQHALVVEIPQDTLYGPNHSLLTHCGSYNWGPRIDQPIWSKITRNQVMIRCRHLPAKHLPIVFSYFSWKIQRKRWKKSKVCPFLV